MKGRKWIAAAWVLLILAGCAAGKPVDEPAEAPAGALAGETLEAMPEEPVEESPEEQSAATVEEAAAWDAGEPITSEEFRLSNGVAMEMTYEEVLEILRTTPELLETADEESLVFREDGVYYVFSPADDGTYRLRSLTLEESCRDLTFFRGIGIGQPIDAVFAKIPAQDTELKQWAFQTIYDEGDHSSSLEFVASSFYSLRINTPAYMANITFSRQETAVKFISVTMNFPLA